MKENTEEFIEKLWIPIYNYCFCRLDYNKDLTDKTVSDIWLVVAKKLPSLRAGAGIRAYVYRVADKCILHNASKNKEKTVNTISFDDAPEETFSIDSYFTDDRSESELAQDLAAALPEEDRELFKMRFIDKMTIQNIAERTDVPYSTIRLHIERMKRHIRLILKDNHIPRIRKEGEYDE